MNAINNDNYSTLTDLSDIKLINIFKTIKDPT